MHPIPTPAKGVIPVTYVQLLYDYLAERNIDAEALLGQAAPVAENGLGRFPVSEWQQHLHKAAIALDDPLLGLHLGGTITPKHLGILGYVLLACGTVGGALQRLQQYHQLIYDVNPMQTRLQAEGLCLAWGHEMGRPGALVDETAIAALLQFCRDITNQPDAAPVAVDFINPQPADISAYQDWFGCPVRFEQDETRVVITPDVLQTPLRSADPALIELLESQANALLASVREEQLGETTQAVQNRLSRLLREGEPTAEQISAELFITNRTLQRRLANEGSSFRQLLQETRHQLAKQYLQDARLQLSEVALLLGYSEQSAFSRAFRQWQSQTPAQYRKQQQSQRPAIGRAATA